MNCGPFFLPVSLEDIEDLAVGITRHGRFYHSGLIFRHSSKQLVLLELSFTGKVMHGQPTDRWAWAVPRIDPSRRRLAAALCETVIDMDPDVYYGFNYERPAEFSMANGALLLGQGMVGLTCATFVISILRGALIHLIDLPSWEPRIDDAKWRDEVYAFMNSKQHYFGIPQNVMNANDPSLPCLRYRPDDVIVGAMSHHVHNAPVSFRRASAGSPAVREWVDALLAIVDKR